MAAIRVLVGDMTPMFRSMVVGLFADRGDIDLVVPDKPGSLAERVAARRCDVVLLRQPDVLDSSGILGSLARSAPIGVVAIGDRGTSGIAYRIERAPIVRTLAGRLDLVAAIHMAAGASPPAATGGGR